MYKVQIKSKHWGKKIKREEKDNCYNTNTFFNLTYLEDSISDEIWKWIKSNWKG